MKFRRVLVLLANFGKWPPRISLCLWKNEDQILFDWFVQAKFSESE
jgi:hypothetical protein